MEINGQCLWSHALIQVRLVKSPKTSIERVKWAFQSQIIISGPSSIPGQIVISTNNSNDSKVNPGGMHTWKSMSYVNTKTNNLYVKLILTLLIRIPVDRVIVFK